MKNESGRIKKNNVTLIEYDNSPVGFSNKYFIQLGVVGVHCTEKELKDLYTVLSYYVNIEEFAECKLEIGGEYVAIQ